MECFSRNGAYGIARTAVLSQRRQCDRDLESPLEVFEGFITDISRSIDPTLGMIIAAMVLFLLDIAVRKFKFKWIHELVREHKEKKAWQSADRRRAPIDSGAAIQFFACTLRRLVL